MSCHAGCGCGSAIDAGAYAAGPLVSSPVTLEGLPLGVGEPCNPVLPFILGAVALFVLPPFLAGVGDGVRLELADHNRRRRRARSRRR